MMSHLAAAVKVGREEDQEEEEGKKKKKRGSEPCAARGQPQRPPR
jgi:hypothetical protein